jgi:hypothetical protein
MWLRQWSSVKDRMRFKSLFSLTILAYEVREIEGLLREGDDDDDDSITSSFDSTESSGVLYFGHTIRFFWLCWRDTFFLGGASSLTSMVVDDY